MLSEAGTQAETVRAAAIAAPGRGKRAAGFLSSLHGRLLMLAAGFVLFAELLIYPPLAAIYRNGWLEGRAQAAQIAVLAVEAAPDGRVSDELSRELLERAQVVSVAVQAEDIRELILAPSIRIDGPLVPIDLRREGLIASISGTFAHLFAPRGRFLQILLPPSVADDSEMEVIVPESALREGIVTFSQTLLIVSIVISAVVGAMVYFAVSRLVVKPIHGLTESVIRFSEQPETADMTFPPGQSDEMQRAFTALQTMQTTVSSAFRQRKRLAELGEAVAKINHDLRNSLAAAQIVSEGLAQSDDPRVKRAAPRLERAIKRAINLAEGTLRYGRAEPPTPILQPTNLIPVVEEAAAEALTAWPEVDWNLEGPASLCAIADPDHVHRIVGNLVRNAARAIAEQPGRSGPGRITGRAFQQGESVIIEITDNGPGIPNMVMGRLFQPFAGSGSRDGAGLGLAIARELARGMKGEVELTSSDKSGAAFLLRIPAAPQPAA